VNLEFILRITDRSGYLLLYYLAGSSYLELAAGILLYLQQLLIEILAQSLKLILFRLKLSLDIMKFLLNCSSLYIFYLHFIQKLLLALLAFFNFMFQPINVGFLPLWHFISTNLVIWVVAFRITILVYWDLKLFNPVLPFHGYLADFLKFLSTELGLIFILINSHSVFLKFLFIPLYFFCIVKLHCLYFLSRNGFLISWWGG